ncbi:GntR family transcriptional regulator [Mesorhizobium sp. M7A.F.Ca.CA.001.09.2.1]|jgi:DNA-binding GntR family transcriptional regulator|uniref:GntR domain protein n=3 Tax=Mesorhizobium TaxID=68287 RepID=E8TC94_MESCW|nr:MULTISPECIES: GntR family transcriptional regulator [Mesorhizobium]RUU15031.1 GntR family transcriptional regulator [Mesorhizobium sp. M7A.T.Ca.TU.009.01.3.2]RUU62753.1 GntR family transcriptional regulator [Mesorhizobium sp. M7A.T.Ca.TU.009.01.1.1]RUU86962.1 GntR family transcriptional regulator [Mesorhizobium sp. M7A.T.Ca.TU.009.01.1.2]RUV13839.1 GntR family transcriptional regulator [Mesorhizobium sp. M7A.T.Ca.TU.009.01.3.1]RUV53094.1 GntR family transcriptional regulator [Mesorhizobium 
MAGSAFRKPGVEIIPLSKETLQDRVYNQVTELILDGSIVPGEMVTVQSLADAFGVSPMPVREALRRLTAANALTVVSGRSIGIPALSRERLTDLRNVRFEIEAIAAGWASQNRSDADLAIFARDLDSLERANGADDVKAYLRANYTFHFAIYRAAGSETLLKIIKDLWLQISPYFNMLHGSYSTANTYHQQMFAALRDRDEQAVQAAVRGDIDAAFDMLVDLLK